MESISFDFEIKDGFAVVEEILTHKGNNIKIKRNDKCENIKISVKENNKHIKFEYPKSAKFSTIKEDIEYYIDVGGRRKKEIVGETKEIIYGDEKGCGNYTCFEVFDGGDDDDIILEGYYRFEAIEAIYEAAKEIKINKRLKDNIIKE